MKSTVCKSTTKTRKPNARTRLVDLGNEFVTAVAENQLRSVNRVFMQSLNMHDTKWVVVLEGQSSPVRLFAKGDVAVATNNWRIQTQHLSKEDATVCFKKTLALLVERGLVEMDEDKSGAKPKTK